MRAAICLAVAYGFCVLAPLGAVAFASDSASLPCIEADHHSISHAAISDDAPAIWAEMNADHDHGDAKEHTDHSHRSHTSGCCGAFCMSALADFSSVSFFRYAISSIVGISVVTSSTGSTPERLIRPPIV